MSLPMTVVALDLGDIFHFLLDSAGVNICCRKVVAITLSLSSAMPGTLLVVLVLLRVDGRSVLSGR